MVRRMTSWWGWALRRARASTGLLLTLLALVTATTAILAGAVGYSGAAATTAARASLTSTVPSEAGIRVQTRQGADPAAQDAAARQRIEAGFAPAPVAIQRTVVSEPRSVQLDGKAVTGRLVVLGSPSLAPGDPDIDDRVQVVEGAWPTDGAAPVQGMLHAATAAEWEVGVGDRLTVGGVEVEVSGLWRPVDAADAYWFGDRLVAAGKDGAQRGPLVVAPGTVAQVVEAPFVRWTVQPDVREIGPDDLGHLAEAAATLKESLKTPEVEVRGVTVDGDLAPTAATASTNLATASALGVIPLSVLALVTILAVVQLARLLATTREAQAQLLVARGASRAQVLAGTLAESALVTVVGSVLGALLAWGVLQAVPAGDAQTGTVVRVAAVTGAVVLVVLAAVAVLQVRRLTAGGTADLSGRARAATALATVVLVLGAAAVAWWQLRRSGSPLVTRDDGTLGTDLVAGAAPALLLAAAAVVAMALLGPASRLVEALTRPGRTAPGHLAAAQVSRRLAVYAVPAVLTVLAVGATTVSGLYAGTSAALRDNLSTVAQGAPVRATLAEPVAVKDPGVIPPPPPSFDGVPGVERSTLVWLDPNATVGDLSVPVTMADLDELAQVAEVPTLPDDAGRLPTDLLATEAVPVRGLPLPDGTRTVDVTLDAEVTIPESALEALQELYEEQADQMLAGSEDVPEEVRFTEEEVRQQSRLFVDQMLAEANQDETYSWNVVLTFVNPRSGQRAEVDGGKVELPRHRIDVPLPLGEAEGEPDYTQYATTPGGGTTTLTYTVPEGTEQFLEAVRLELPTSRQDRWDPLGTQVDVKLRAVTDTGEELFGTATAGWGSLEAAPPEVVAERDAERERTGKTTSSYMDPRTGQVFTFEESYFVPALLDTDATTWVLSGVPQSTLPNRVDIAPGVEWTDPALRSGQGQAPGSSGGAGQPAPTTTAPLAITTQAAAAANLAVGDTTSITAFGTVVPVTVAAVLPAVPGTLAPHAALLDRDAVAARLAERGRALTDPTEVWATAVDGQEAALVEQLAGDPRITSATGSSGTAITDATSAARLVFWVASAGAVLLAVTGIAAVAATLLGQRRPEVAVLRALGMPPRAQARSRASELGGVVLAAVLLGLGAGWLVGRAVVPELARSTTLRGQVSLPAGLELEPALWAALLGVGALAVLGVILVQGRRVAAQALDHDYREEIR